MAGPSLTHDRALDAARGGLMVLGIVLHAAKVYSPGNEWLISDSAQAVALYWLDSAIHVFRMPAFFWISGFLCAYSLQRLGPARFLRRRLPRIAIPLFFAWGTLNVPLVALLAWLHGRNVGNEIAAGVPLFHLWFLVDLLVFFLVAATAIWPLLTRLEALDTGNFPRIHPLALVAILTIASLLIVGLIRVSDVAYIELLGLTTPFRLSTYFPYFLVGMLMYRVPRVDAAFRQINPLWLFPALVAGVWANELTQDPVWALAETGVVIVVVTSWLGIGAVIGVARMLSNFPKVSEKLAESSYSIYLLHHLVVVAAAACLLNFDWPPFVKFATVVAVTYSLCACIHFSLIRKSRLLSFLFGGRMTRAPSSHS